VGEASSARISAGEEARQMLELHLLYMSGHLAPSVALGTMRNVLPRLISPV
jgi:hypothetical protein